MAQPRPIVRDNLSSHGWPVAAVRLTRLEAALPCPAAVTHPHAALAFCTGGSARVELKGVSNVREGDVLLVPAGEPHRLLGAQGLELWGLAFCVPCFASGGAASMLTPFERVRGGGSPVAEIPSARHAHLEGLFHELESLGREALAPADAVEAVQRSLLTLILAEVERASRPSGAPPGGGGVVADALRFIERHCLGHLTLEQVAAALGRSPTYVTTALTRATGRSAGQWILSGRMAEARRLLLHSDERIDVIGERVGYADATHFIRMFRREHGATPAAWRAAAARRPPPPAALESLRRVKAPRGPRPPATGRS